MMMDVDPVQELHRATEQGDIEHVQQALDAGMLIVKHHQFNSKMIKAQLTRHRASHFGFSSFSDQKQI